MRAAVGPGVPDGPEATPRLARGPLLLALLVLPRLLRPLGGLVWIEDEGYLNAALMLRHGFAPYSEAPLLNFPLLDGLLAGLVAAAGASLRAVEALTQLVVLLASWQVVRLGARLAGPRAGAAAGLLFAWSALLLRYHVFEREPFLLVPLLAATTLALDARDARRGVAVGGWLALALLVKLTALGAAVGLLAWIGLGARQPRAAGAAAVAMGAVMAAATAGCWMAWGDAFLGSVFVFRLVRAPQTLIEKLPQLKVATDLTVVVGLGGLVWVASMARARRSELLFWLLAGSFVWVIVLNPGLWAHNVIELLPWLAVAGGWLLADLGGLEARSRRGRTAGLAALGVLALASVAAFGGSGPTSFALALGGLPRDEVTAAAARIREAAAPDERVAVPGHLAFEANRIEAVPYPEVTPTVVEVRDRIARDGLVATIRELRGAREQFWEQVFRQLERWRVAQLRDVASGRIPVVVNSQRDEGPPWVQVPVALLEGSGFVRTFVGRRYVVWARVAAGAGAGSPR